MNAKLTPLHVRSGYSLLEGAAAPGHLVGLAVKLGYEAMAMTDVNNLYGATVFFNQAEQAGIKPITGAELRKKGRTAVALVTAAQGYRNLCRIISRVHADPPAETLTGDLARLHAGLEIITDQADLAEHLLAAGVPAQQLWLEIDPATQPHRQVRQLTDSARRLGLSLVATGKALLGQVDDHETARLLAAIRLGTTLDAAADTALPHPAAVLRGPDQLAGQLREFPEAIANNRRLAERCTFRLLPRKPVFPRFRPPDGQSPRHLLWQLCREGLTRRYGTSPAPEAERRLRRELELIEQLGFVEYFLVVWDIVRYARQRGNPVAGRGSGGSSLAAYLLGITNVCPLTFDIPFERFLHAGREDFPDLDIDFCWRIRDEVIEHVFDRWGRDHVAMVSTHNAFGARSAFRETAKALGFSDEQITRMARRGTDADQIARISKLSRRILHLPHLLSVHPGGVVITPGPIGDYAPIQQAAKGVMITQYDKDGCEDVGLVKLDLLGNRSLSTARYACELIRQTHGQAIDIEALPPKDPPTLELLQAADTVGCNQLESPAMRHLLKMLQPKQISDVMKALALIRPGAASIGMKETFVRRHRGLAPVGANLPAVQKVLAETYGVMLYEDDVMLTAAAMLGAGPIEADYFRRAIKTCSTDAEREALSREFLTRCQAAGADQAYASDIWVQMAKFNAYSFCRAHAASYAMLAYAVAYLKAHWPVEFWTAAINNNQSMYPLRVYIEQAKRAGVRFGGPDVNRSEAEFAIDAGTIRVGLAFVHGLGPAGTESILSARSSRPFSGVTDLLARTGLGCDEVRSLILCGAFDSTSRTRPEAMMELQLYLTQRPGSFPTERTLLPVAANLPKLAGDYSRTRKYLDERHVLGFSTGRHVMELYRPDLAGRVNADSRDIPRNVGRPLKLAGMLEAQRTTRTRQGRQMRFCTFDDEYGLFEVTVFASLCQATSYAHHGPYIVAGIVADQYGALTVSARNVSLYQPAKPPAANAS